MWRKMLSWNWGMILAWSGIIQSVGASIGYFVIGDYRKAFYFMFGALITTTVVL